MSGSIEIPAYSEISSTDDDESSIDLTIGKSCTSTDLFSSIVPNCDNNSAISTIVDPLTDHNRDSDSTGWSGFKIVGDNVDYHVKPRFMTSDRQSKSVHCFNSIVVKDRIDFSSYSDEPLLSSLPPNTSTADILLPSVGDDTKIANNFLFLIKRIIRGHMLFFQRSCGDIIDRHLSHKYSDEMSTESEIVGKMLTVKCERNNFIYF